MLRLLCNRAILLSMAIEFARAHVLSRSAGHSAVKAAAYRAGEKLRDERTGRVADYSHRSADVLVAKILLPEGADPAFSDRTTLWEAVEAREDEHNRRASAQLAKDYIIALPRELNESGRAELAEAFARSEFVSKGLVVDMAIHAHSDGNPHAHLLTTTRALEGSRFGKKVREVNGKFYGGVKLADEEQLRHRWADFQNSYFRQHGIDVVISNHSGEYTAEKHLGAVSQMHERGIATELYDTVQEIRSTREQAILDRPEIVIDRVADKKAVFTKHDLYRELNKVVKSPAAFAAIKAKLDVHDSLVLMKSGGEKEYLTTIGTLKIEQSIRQIAQKLVAEGSRFAINDSVRESVLKDYEFLSQEQKAAVEHLTGKERLGIVMGLAGAGKSTLLDAVRRINELSGHQVYGVALAGKAAEELESSSGIASSTIASFLYGVRSGRIELTAGDVLAVDEFGMVSNKQTNELFKIAESVGAKVIVVGDTEQLQSIQAGAALCDLSKRHGYAGIETIRRQSAQWQRDATLALAKGRAGDAVSAYRDKGHLHVTTQGDATGALDALVVDYLADERSGSKAVLAHRVDDVKMLNDRIRAALVSKGSLGSSKAFRANVGRGEQRLAFDLEPGDEVMFKSRDRGLGIQENDSGTYLGTESGNLHFVHDDGRELSFMGERYSDIEIPDKVEKQKNIDLSAGDRILFTRNDKELGVSNGQLGTLISYTHGNLSVKTDSGKLVNFRQEDYSDIAHGYATTVHKSQGMTVDRSYMLGTRSMDKHLAYVGMSRHRETLEIYTNDESGFVSAVSRDNRQETALDFAETRGLELVSDVHSDTLDRILTGEEAGSMAVESINDAISKADYQRATRRLEAEQSKIAAQLSESAKEPIVLLERRAMDLASDLKQRELNKPKPGLFKTKAYEAKERTWIHEIKVMTAERNGVLRQIESAQSGAVFVEFQERIQQEATRMAARALPQESTIVKGYQADRRVSDLNHKLIQIDADITTARTTGNEKTLSRLLKSKSTVLNNLHNSESIRRRLGSQERNQIDKAMQATKKELNLFKSRGLGLGR